MTIEQTIKQLEANCNAAEEKGEVIVYVPIVIACNILEYLREYRKEHEHNLTTVCPRFSGRAK